MEQTIGVVGHYFLHLIMLKGARLKDGADGLSLENITQDVVTRDIKIKAQIQEIQGCGSSLQELNELNRAVRSELEGQRRQLARLEEAARRPDHQLERAHLLQQAATYSRQLASQVVQLRRANVTAQFNIERRHAAELFDDRPTGEVVRQRRGQDQLNKMASQVTGNLLSINRQLAEQVDRSKQTLDVLVNSSDKVSDTHEELKSVGGAIGQSGRLLSKYGRRELTDNVLFLLAFAFFFACVLYVVKKRLWGW